MLRLLSKAPRSSVVKATGGLFTFQQQSLNTLKASTAILSLRNFASTSLFQYEDRGSNRYNNNNNGGYQNNNNGGYNNNNNNGGYRNNNKNRFSNDRRGGAKFSRNRKGNGATNFDSSRNNASARGSEGDGLRGMEDYERNTDLSNVDLNQIAKEAQTGTEQESNPPANKNDFSLVNTELLGEHKILSRVLVNSLLYNRKYEHLTKVQSQTMIPILRGESVVVKAKTGTGKTAAFSVPTIQFVLDALKEEEANSDLMPKDSHKTLYGASGTVKAIIISPTRELAQQIADEITAITAYGEMRKISTVCMVGGVPKIPQLRHAFQRQRCADIIVATPGRLYDVLQEPGLEKFFADVKIKVLDEADRLLDIGFSRELEQIDEVLINLSKGAQKYQTLLFSATIDKRVRDFARMELGARAKVVDTVPKDEPEAHALVDQSIVVCQNWKEIYPAAYLEITKALKRHLEFSESLPYEERKPFKGIVFMPTVPTVSHYHDVLKSAFKMAQKSLGIRESKGLIPRVYTIHGQMSQGARQRAADDFKKLKEPVLLVTTDVVARGMDFPNVTNVFQMGTPRDAASYVHRIGRTGRIGHRGEACMIMTKDELPYLRLLGQKNIKIENLRQFKHSDVKITQEQIEGAEEPEKSITDTDAFYSALDLVDLDAEESIRLIEGLLSSYAYMRRDFGVNGVEFLKKNEAFATELFKLQDHVWSRKLYESWGASNQRRGGYWNGSNRRESSFAQRGFNNNKSSANYRRANFNDDDFRAYEPRSNSRRRF